MSADAGAPLRFLAVDTQSRTIDGDENSTKDGSKYAKAIERIRRETGASLWIISHIGHAENAQDRPRGNSSLLAAYDTFYLHKKKDKTHGSIKITVDRDGLGQKEFDFVVDLFDTGAVNENGEPVLVPFVAKDDAPTRAGNLGGLGFVVKPIEPTDTEQEALRALRQAIKDHGIAGPEQGEPVTEHIPAGLTVVFKENWAEAFYKLDRVRVAGASRMAFSRGSKGLTAKKFVGAHADWRWLNEPEKYNPDA